MKPVQLLFATLFFFVSSGAVPIDRYDVTLTGTVKGQTFTRIASFYLAPSLDAFLVSGFPFATPEVGAIWLASNRAFYNLVESRYPPGQFQLMTVEPDGQGTVTYQILENVAQQSYVSNSMSASFGIFAFDYTLTGGTMVCTFDGANVVGSVDVIGKSRNTLIDEQYVAQFSGVRVETFEFVI